MSCNEFQADFYNNIAAVAVVLLFAKVITRRQSQAKRGDWPAVIHALLVDVLIDELTARSRRRGSPGTQPSDPVTAPVSQN